MSVSGLVPLYSVIKINMGDTDGQTAVGRLISQQTGFIKAAFRDVNGAPVNNVRVQIAFGRQDDDKIILDYNGKVRCLVPIHGNAGQVTGKQTVDQFRAFWANTPGVFCYLTISQDSQLFEDDTPNPIQSFTQSVGTIINQGNVSIGTSATLIRAANANRQSLIMKNIGSAAIFIGNSGVTTANGQQLDAGQVITLDKSNSDVYGIVASSTVNLRWLEETL